MWKSHINRQFGEEKKVISLDVSNTSRTQKVKYRVFCYFVDKLRGMRVHMNIFFFNGTHGSNSLVMSKFQVRSLQTWTEIFVHNLNNNEITAVNFSTDLPCFMCNRKKFQDVMEKWFLHTFRPILNYGAYSAVYFVHDWCPLPALVIISSHFGQSKVYLWKSSLQYLHQC